MKHKPAVALIGNILLNVLLNVTTANVHFPSVAIKCGWMAVLVHTTVLLVWNDWFKTAIAFPAKQRFGGRRMTSLIVVGALSLFLGELYWLSIDKAYSAWLAGTDRGLSNARLKSNVLDLTRRMKDLHQRIQSDKMASWGRYQARIANLKNENEKHEEFQRFSEQSLRDDTTNVIEFSSLKAEAIGLATELLKRTSPRAADKANTLFPDVVEILAGPAPILEVTTYLESMAFRLDPDE